jgi:hypothetical protein
MIDVETKKAIKKLVSEAPEDKKREALNYAAWQYGVTVEQVEDIMREGEPKKPKPTTFKITIKPKEKAKP